MATNRNSEHLRYRYGICLSDSCSKCKSKEVQQIPARKDFVCTECGKALRECPPPKSFMDRFGTIIYASIGVLVVAALILWFILSPKDDKPTIFEDSLSSESISENSSVDEVKTVEAEPVVEEVEIEPETPSESASDSQPSNNAIEKTVSTSQPVAPQGKAQASSNGIGSKNIEYGVYNGPMENGLPHGIGGEVKVRCNYELDLKKANGETLSLVPGDIIVNTKFVNGKLRQGELQRKDGSRKYIII